MRALAVVGCAVLATGGLVPGAWARIVAVPVASGFHAPVEVVNAADNSGRLFVVEQGGRFKLPAAMRSLRPLSSVCRPGS
ncbi:MAG: hypothetical protein M3Z31_18595 [Pseudomonadota bacterium]|nr:hypothetical protein [Pseudomonadota bacterium]